MKQHISKKFVPKVNSKKLFAAGLMDLVFSVSERVNEMKAEPVGDDSQVTLPSLDPPIRFCKRGGSEKRKVVWQMTETWNYSLSPLDSYSPEIFHSPSPPSPPHIYYCSLCCPLDTVSLTDWLLHCHSYCSYFIIISLPLSHPHRL